MKKIGSIILVLAFLMGIMQIAVSAQGGVNETVPTCSCCEVDYSIPEDFSPELRAQVLAVMFGTEEDEPEQDRNILCTLFGHKYEDVGDSISIVHNVYTTSPKCVKNVYTTFTCSRCGDTKTELTSSTRISTCHG